ncbi:hypothetical protein CNE_BB1p06650 (plasmid) [Cupriavidus necator N-1]|uniref:DNA-binding protein H-NS-like C-terminal domain-containing protein n=1 Tax=Cupriavidus necator (strain ATCC 43291 / DSM 13513 / CCUG 52238 / LMG 8453 / N-1) TaxID=1042878 RepID=F8GXL5_CUPNN|nr:hypothetical protein CNE_BB1p06650 [Cupriavidus necator N-1]
MTVKMSGRRRSTGSRPGWRTTGRPWRSWKRRGCFDPPPPPPPPPPPAPPPVVCYRNAAGQSWDGQGGMPDWLRRAVNAGQSVEFFRVG